MAELVRFELGDGSFALFETGDGGIVRAHRGDADPLEAGNLRDRLAGAAQAAQTVSAALRDKVAPDELTLELGLKLSAEANWFVARSSMEGSIKVTLKWKNPPATD